MWVTRVLQGEVKEKETANDEYHKAVDSGKAAGILDHSENASDVFQIRLGNIAADSKVVVEITFVQELKQDAQSDGIRYTLPDSIAPRYGCNPDWDVMASSVRPERHGVSVTVDVAVDKGSAVRGIDSPSHPIKLLLGRTSLALESTFEPHHASGSLHLAIDQARLNHDFVVIVNADGQDKPYALLETHPSIPNQRALMTSLVPKFDIPSSNPEIVFVIDRSGSMWDKIPTLRSALKILLKSLPLGVHFNICSFGSRHEFLWRESQPYSQSSLEDANQLADSLDSNFGGTEMQRAIEATVDKRLGDKELEVLMLTDGQIWNQQRLFSFVTEAASKKDVRFFTLGIGDAASHALVEGVARAGNGFSQSVLNYEELDRKVIRMLKGALTPHIQDYKLEVEYDTPAQDHDFEMVDSSDETVSVQTKEENPKTTLPDAPKQPISLYDSEYKEPNISIKPVEETDLPSIPLPAQIQAPAKIPNLYPFIRSTVYVLLGPQDSDRIPKSLVFKATSKHGPLVLKIPVHDVGQGQIIHQLASRKAVIELEEGRGWLGDHVKELGRSKLSGVIARECQRLGTRFQVTGKHCSFVAVDKTSPSTHDQESKCDIVAADDLRNFSLELHFDGPGDPAGFGCMAPAASKSAGGLERDPGPSLFGGSWGGARGTSSQLVSVSMDGSPMASCAPPKMASRSAQSRKMRMVRMEASAPSSLVQYSAHDPDELELDDDANNRTARNQRTSSPDVWEGELKGSIANTFAPNRHQHWPNASFCSTRDDNGAVSMGAVENSTYKTPSKVHAVIALQSFEGYWKWSQKLLDIFDLKEPDVKAEIANKLQDNAVCAHEFALGDRAMTIATLLAMSFLEKKCADSKATWDLVLVKAENWVQSGSQVEKDVLDKYKAAVNVLF